MLLVLSLIVGFLGLIYIYFTYILNYWKKHGITGIFPLPLIGSFPKSFFQLQSMVYDVDKVYKKFKGITPIIGYFMGSTPCIIVLDPKLIKAILITKFKHFHVNQLAGSVDKEIDPICGRHPFFLTNYDEWKEKRTEIIPALTSNRVKILFPITLDICSKMTKFIHMNLKNDRSHCFDGSDLSLRYITDHLVCAIYGLDSKTFESNEPTIILKHTSDIANNFFPIKHIIYTALCFIMPIFKNFYKIAIIKPKTIELFNRLLRKSIDIRCTKNNNTEDFLNHLLKLQKKKNLQLIDMEAHMATVYIDTIVTSTQMLTLNLYFLAKYPRVQEKLRNEINMVIKNNNNEFTYGILVEMLYLDQVFYETLRIVPDDFALIKVCTKKTIFHDYNGKEMNIEPGTEVLLPVYSIHHDPEYFINPEEYHPERFNAEHGGIKPFRNAGTFLPWGDGPRICIGLQFASLQIKLAIIEIIRHFNVKLSSKTLEEFRFDARSVGLMLDGGIWLNFEPIQTN